MDWPFLIIAGFTIAAAAAAMTLRNLIHCALAVALAFVGLAAAYLQLNAQFVGFAQILVYVGAVAILIVFAALLTRGGEPSQVGIFSKTWLAGLGVALAVLGVLAWAIARSVVTQNQAPPTAEATVKQIGNALMTQYVLPLEIVGLLLTAALIGAVIIAMRDEATKPVVEDGRSKTKSSAKPTSVGGHE